MAEKDEDVTSTPCDLIKAGYFLGKEIGSGTYSTVRLADYLDPVTGKKHPLACKIVNSEQSTLRFLTKFFPRELQILSSVAHPNIVRVHSVVEQDPCVFIFMHYSENGDLYNYIVENGFIAEPQCRIWFRQMVDAVQYLHNKNIAHRDLKCENILLERNYNVKIADFGFARSCVDDSGRKVFSNTYCGTPLYSAPEISSRKPYKPKKLDIWSLGIILFMMLNSQFPFVNSNPANILREKMNRNWNFLPEIEEITSTAVKSLMEQLLEPDFLKRPTINKVANREWVEHAYQKSSTVATKQELTGKEDVHKECDDEESSSHVQVQDNSRPSSPHSPSKEEELALASNDQKSHKIPTGMESRLI